MKEVKYCRKRDGTIVAFEKSRIVAAIHKAFLEANEGNRFIAHKVTETVVERVARIFLDDIPDVETIQDVVEEVLAEYRFLKTAKSYILYRDEHNRSRKATLV